MTVAPPRDDRHLWGHGCRIIRPPRSPPDSRPVDDLRDQLQRTLGDQYAIDRELGGGGMSRVFVAVETALHRRVVVKLLPREMAASVSVERFKREIALAARLQHPHIVPLLSAGDTDGLPYFTMPMVEGESLRARLARGGELPVAEGLRLLREVASALDYAHEKGVVHRDIKPDNVLLSRGSAMVSDFGVAKALSASSNAENSGMTSLGVALGTPAYMSPEQAAASPTIDARADVYSFGIMAYELFAGRPPFAGRSPQAMLAAHVTEPPEHVLKLRPSLPPALATLVMRCLEKNPADRPQTAADIVHALDAINTPSGGMQPTAAVPAYTPAPTSGAGDRTSTPAPTPAAGGTRRLGVIALAVLGIAGTVIGVSTLLKRGKPASGGTATEAAATKSIAIVPFVGGDTKDEYFADGVADELTSMLARVPGLGVVARSSAFAFKGKPLSSRQIGDSLHVANVVEGTVRRSESRLRITASLIGVANGLTLWSDSYDVDPKDVFAVQQQIASKIADQLKVTLGTGGGSGGTRNLEAHDLYLQGLFHADNLVDSEQRLALANFEKAVALDSNFAAAWAGIANVWSVLADDWVAPKESYPKAKAAAQRALALDPQLAEGHTALAATLLWWDRDIPRALAEAERGVTLKPSSKQGLFQLGYTLIYEPKLADSALAVFRRAEQLDPHYAVMAAYVCQSLIDKADWRAAEAECKRGTELDPASPDAALGLAAYYRARKQYPEALAAAARGTLSPDRMRMMLFAVNLEMGKRDEAKRILMEAVATAKTRYVRPDPLAYAFLQLGDKENAILWLGKAVEFRSASLLAELGDKLFGHPLIKDDPRVKAMAAQVKASITRLP
jgi:TolB-like protein/tRNA A-37 threonylcarbamoyl transferase component Bud32/Tfp pilus assembly protein PilF